MNNEFEYEGVWEPPIIYGRTYFCIDVMQRKGCSQYTWNGGADDLRNIYLNHAFSTWEKAHETYLSIIKYLALNKEKFNFIEDEPKEGEKVWISNSLYPLWSACIEYDSSYESGHNVLFENHFLYSSEEKAINAIRGILQFLHKVRARERFKPLTEAPQDGTIVYLADVKNGYEKIIYSDKFEYLLKAELLFPRMLNAMQASLAMRKLINPSQVVFFNGEKIL